MLNEFHEFQVDTQIFISSPFRNQLLSSPESFLFSNKPDDFSFVYFSQMCIESCTVKLSVAHHYVRISKNLQKYPGMLESLDGFLDHLGVLGHGREINNKVNL